MLKAVAEYSVQPGKYLKRLPESEKPFDESTIENDQCLLLKSLKDPLGGAGAGLFGIVASQIIFDRLRSIGDIVIASRNTARNPRAKIRSIPAETRIASKKTGITAPRLI